MLDFCTEFYEIDDKKIINFFMNIGKTDKIYKLFFETDKKVYTLYILYYLLTHIDDEIQDGIWIENEDAYWNGLYNNFINKNESSYGEY